MEERTKKFGLLSIILLGVNTIIGSGIFLLPHQTYQLVGTGSLFIFIIDALLAISIGLCFAEASNYFTQNGGPYVYAKEAFGEFVGFEVGFIKWVVTMIAIETQANAFATIVRATFPNLDTDFGQKVVITGLLLFLMVINLLGTSSAKWVNNIATIGKLVPLVLFVGLGLLAMHRTNFGALNELFSGSSQIGSAAVLMFYGFAGVESIPVAAEEMNNPKKELPKAIIIVMTIVPLLYILIQTVSIGVLGNALDEQEAPIQYAMQGFLGNVGLWIVAFGTLLSIGGITVALSFVGPRSATALAEDGLLPQMMLKENRFKAPVWSVVISSIITFVIAMSGSFTTLATISVVARFAQYIPTILAVIKFRRTLPQTDGFRIPGGLFVPIVALMASIWLVLQTNGSELFFGLLGLLVGIPIYGIMKWLQQRQIEAI